MNKIFRTDIEVEFRHLDTQKYVNHSNIYTYIENAYINFFMYEIGTGWTFSNMPILLKTSSMEFFKPITETSKLVVELKVSNVRSKGVELEVKLNDRRNLNVCYAAGKRVLIHCDLSTAQPKKFEVEIYEKLKQFCNDC